MTAGPDDEDGRGSDDILAAEYVLGVLPDDERRDAARRIETDPAFSRLVDAWEVRLAPLGSGYDEVEPPASAWAAIEARLFGGAAHAPPAGLPLLQRLAFWRGLAAAALAALLVAVALPYLQTPPAPPAERLVASLASEETLVRYLVLYDARAGEIGLSHVTGDREAGRDFELWLIEGSNAPVSLGVIPAGANVHIAVAPAHRAMIASGVVFAISLEPAGGSPSGQPTGPVVAAGDLRTV